MYTKIELCDIGLYAKLLYSIMNDKDTRMELLCNLNNEISYQNNIEIQKIFKDKSLLDDIKNSLYYTNNKNDISFQAKQNKLFNIINAVLETISYKREIFFDYEFDTKDDILITFNQKEAIALIRVFTDNLNIFYIITNHFINFYFHQKNTFTIIDILDSLFILENICEKVNDAETTICSDNNIYNVKYQSEIQVIIFTRFLIVNGFLRDIRLAIISKYYKQSISKINQHYKSLNTDSPNAIKHCKKLLSVERKVNYQDIEINEPLKYDNTLKSAFKILKNHVSSSIFTKMLISDLLDMNYNINVLKILNLLDYIKLKLIYSVNSKEYYKKIADNSTKKILEIFLMSSKHNLGSFIEISKQNLEKQVSHDKTTINHICNKCDLFRKKIQNSNIVDELNNIKICLYNMEKHENSLKEYMKVGNEKTPSNLVKFILSNIFYKANDESLLIEGKELNSENCYDNIKSSKNMKKILIYISSTVLQEFITNLQILTTFINSIDDIGLDKLKPNTETILNKIYPDKDLSVIDMFEKSNIKYSHQEKYHNTLNCLKDTDVLLLVYLYYLNIICEEKSKNSTKLYRLLKCKSKGKLFLD